jgi:hypothetical protein
MAISETAEKNHDDLFPGHVSTLKVTDPEPRVYLGAALCPPSKGDTLRRRG